MAFWCLNEMSFEYSHLSKTSINIYTPFYGIKWPFDAWMRCHLNTYIFMRHKTTSTRFKMALNNNLHAFLWHQMAFWCLNEMSFEYSHLSKTSINIYTPFYGIKWHFDAWMRCHLNTYIFMRHKTTSTRFKMALNNNYTPFYDIKWPFDAWMRCHLNTYIFMRHKTTSTRFKMALNNNYTPFYDIKWPFDAWMRCHLNTHIFLRHQLTSTRLFMASNGLLMLEWDVIWILTYLWDIKRRRRALKWR